MSKESSNVAILKHCYQEWARNKAQSSEMWMPMMADDIRFGTIGEGENRPAYFKLQTRKDMLKEYFDGLARDWAMISYEAREFIAQGDVVVMRGHCAYVFKKTGKTCSTAKFDYWRFKDGKAVEFYESFDTAAMMEATRA